MRLPPHTLCDPYFPRSTQHLESLLVVPAYGYGSLQEYYEGDTAKIKVEGGRSKLYLPVFFLLDAAWCTLSLPLIP